MKHIKTYHAKEIETPHGSLMVEGSLSGSVIKSYDFHHDLIAFRRPDEQHEAIIEIADLPEGRIIIARREQTIVGYTTFHYPDPLEHWSGGNMENLIELGGIEVIPELRGNSVGKNLLQVSMMDVAMEDYIVISTEYYWHWDLEGTGLSTVQYRKVMEKMMNAGGLEWFATDEPEICSHPANCLMARVGKRVNSESVERFDRLRFANRFMY